MALRMNMDEALYRLRREKGNFIQELNNLEEHRQELEDILHQERERRMHQQQQIDDYIRQLEFERDEAIRTKTLETAALRKMNNILKSHIRDFERQQALFLNNNPSSDPPSDFSNDFLSFNNPGIDDSNWDDDFSLIDNSDLHTNHNEPPAQPQVTPYSAPKANDSKRKPAPQPPLQIQQPPNLPQQQQPLQAGQQGRNTRNLSLRQMTQLLRQRNRGKNEEGSQPAPFLRSEVMFRQQSATESDLDFYGEPIPGITTMFTNCTISEDRTGTEEEIMAHRLAALRAHCERKMDLTKIQ
jgi:hypothetical protein